MKDELARNPRIGFTELFWNVVRATAPGMGNDPNQEGVPAGALASIAALWRENPPA